MQFHNKITAILQDPSSWAGFAIIFTTLGEQLDSHICYFLAAIFSVAAIVIKNPK